MKAVTSLALVLSLAACGIAKPDRPSPSDCREAAGASSSAPLVDAPLVAFLSKARAVHLQADIAESGGDVAEAVRLLDSLVRSPAVGGEYPSPEVREVLADTCARLGELEASRGAFDAARRFVKRGLELATDRTHYRGRLYEVLGAIERRAYDKLRAQGDETAARAAKERATAALQEAVSIQEDVIRRALGGAP